MYFTPRAIHIHTRPSVQYPQSVWLLGVSKLNCMWYDFTMLILLRGLSLIKRFGCAIIHGFGSHTSLLMSSIANPKGGGGCGFRPANRVTRRSATGLGNDGGGKAVAPRRFRGFPGDELAHMRIGGGWAWACVVYRADTLSFDCACRKYGFGGIVHPCISR